MSTRGSPRRKLVFGETSTADENIHSSTPNITHQDSQDAENIENLGGPPLSPVISEGSLFTSVASSASGEQSSRRRRNSGRVSGSTCSLHGCTFHTEERKVMRDHLKAVHMWTKFSFCSACPDIFKYYESKDDHEVMMHGIRRIRPCTGCGDVFPTVTKLKYHRRKCTACFRPFTCSVCGRSLFTEKGCRIHKECRHKEEREVSREESQAEVEQMIR